MSSNILNNNYPQDFDELAHAQPSPSTLSSLLKIQKRGHGTTDYPCLSSSIDNISLSLADAFAVAPLPIPYQRYGHVTHINATLITASLPGVALGELCLIAPETQHHKLSSLDEEEIASLVTAEVIAIDQHAVTLSPFSDPTGLAVGNLVRSLGRTHQVQVGDHLLGQIVDGLGQLLEQPGAESSDAIVVPNSNSISKVEREGKRAVTRQYSQYGEESRSDADKVIRMKWDRNKYCETRSLEAPAPHPLSRQHIETPFPLGIRALDGLLTCGLGQRLGIFAAAGGGKSTLLGMICAHTQAEIIVLGLIGERGREVKEFLEKTLDPKARARTVLVIATSDRPAIERLKAAYTATVIAEYFRDQGKNVLLMMDSLTRFARAAREIGMAAGEPLSAGGGSFPPSLYARLPRLLERAGCSDKGSITALYTVLVEGDNLNEPLADEVRSILDGHIVLSRKLAQENHYPAIDISASISRVMQQITSPAHMQSADKLRKLIAAYKEVELLIRVGEYQSGQDKLADEAIARHSAIKQFLCQTNHEKIGFTEVISKLKQTVG